MICICCREAADAAACILLFWKLDVEFDGAVEEKDAEQKKNIRREVPFFFGLFLLASLSCRLCSSVQRLVQLSVRLIAHGVLRCERFAICPISRSTSCLFPSSSPSELQRAARMKPLSRR